MPLPSLTRTVAIRTVASAVLLCGTFAAYTQQQREPVELSILEVRDDLYAIRGNARGNVGVYITGDGVILVDDEFQVDYPNLIAAIRSLTDQPVKYVLNTHHHSDHSDGNPNFLPTAEILIHANARANMIRNGQAGIPRIAFADEAQVFLGGKEARIRHFGRAHTNGDAVVLFPGARAIHTGDLYVNGPFFIPNYPDGGSLKDWPATIRGVLELDFDVVIPGHGPMATRADMVRFADRLDEMWSRIGQMNREGKSKAAIAEMLRADFAEFGASVAGDTPMDGILAELGAR